MIGNFYVSRNTFDISSSKLWLSKTVIVHHPCAIMQAIASNYENIIQLYRYKYCTRGWNSFIIFASHWWKAERLKLRAQWGKSEIAEESEKGMRERRGKSVREEERK